MAAFTAAEPFLCRCNWAATSPARSWRWARRWTTSSRATRVVGLVHPENPASVNAIRGLGNLSTGVDLPGHTMFGGYAQYVARPRSYWIKIAPALSFDQAAAAMWACSTAHHIVAGRLHVRMNDNVLITGASGGMGTATLQLVKLAGGTPIATTRSAAKADALRRAGAESCRRYQHARCIADNSRVHPRRRRRWRGRVYRRNGADALMHRRDAVRRHLLPGRR